MLLGCQTSLCVLVLLSTPQVVERQELQLQAQGVDRVREQLQLIAQPQVGSEPTSGASGSASAAQQQQQHQDAGAFAKQLEQSQQELRAALAAASEAQQEARTLRRHLSTQQKPDDQQLAYNSSSSASPFAEAAGGQPANSRSHSGSNVAAAEAAGREAKLAAENRDLVERLAATHQKLKQLRAKSQQREAVQQAQVRFCVDVAVLVLAAVMAVFS